MRLVTFFGRATFPHFARGLAPIGFYVGPGYFCFFGVGVVFARAFFVKFPKAIFNFRAISRRFFGV